MRGTLAIAQNTFREVIRARVLYVLAFFAVLIILSSKAVGWVSAGQDIKVITDIGLAAIPFFSVLIAIFVGTGLVYQEIEKRTLYIILARPIRREAYILGKYLGFLAGVFLVQTLMLAAFLLYLAVWLHGWQPGQFEGGVGFSPALAQACLLAYGEVALMTAVALFFSSVSTPILSACFTFAAYAVGSNADGLLLIPSFVRPAELSAGGQAVLRAAVELGYSLVPNLSAFNMRGLATHGLALPWADVASSLLYGLLYSAGLLCLAALAFRRRNL